MNDTPTPDTDEHEFPCMTWPSQDHPMVVRADFARKLERERDEAREYADKLAEGLPDGMLPKDVEVLREANLGLATNIAAVTEQRDRLAEALRVATAYPLSESWYKQAIDALATLKPCD
jgi:phage terminase Nu1 subunit (DNA packaging protein)